MIGKLEYKWLVGIVFVVALFMDLLDITVTNVAIPTLANEFNATTTTIEWVITGYLLSLAVFIPISGWLGDRFGTKLVFVSALSLFIVASLLCGLAWNIESLIAFRVLQGVGGGMLTPVGTTMLSRAFPPSERAAASAVLSIPITVATVLTNCLGFHDAALGDPATQEGALLAFHDAFIFGGALIILGIIACFLIDDEKAAQATDQRFEEVPVG